MKFKEVGGLTGSIGPPNEVFNIIKATSWTPTACERSRESEGKVVVLVSFPWRSITGWSEHPRVLPLSHVRSLIRDSTALERTQESRAER